MRKILPFIVVILVVLSYIGCSKTSNPVNPTNVTIVVTHQVRTTHDTVDFFANSSEDVRVTFIKAYWADSTKDSANVNTTWNKNTTNSFANFRYLTGVYRYDFRGTFVSGGAPYSYSAVDTVR